MKEKELIDTKSMIKEINSQKAPTFQKNKKMDSTLKTIRASNGTDTSKMQINNIKTAMQMKRTIINAFNK